MVYYWFTDPLTGVDANIEDVKNEFYDNLRSPADEMTFELLVLIGIYCTLRGEFEMSRFLSISAATDLPQSDVYLYFLHGRYHFGAGH